MSNITIRSIKTLFIILLLLICSYQVYKICYLYLSYCTTTSVTYDQLSDLSLPGITLCFDKQWILRDDYKQQMLKQYNASVNSTDWKRLVNSLSIAGQMNVLLSMDEIFGNSCHVLKPLAFASRSGYYIPCHTITPVIQRMDYQNMCFTFLSQLSDETDDRYVIRDDLIYKDHFNDLFHVSIAGQIPSVNMIIHSRFEHMVNTGKKRMLKFANRPKTVHYTEYHQTVVHSLPAPYETNCYDYTLIGYKSRLDCIENCRVEWMADYVTGWPGNYMTDNLTSDALIVNMYELFHENYTLDAVFGDHCRRECGTCIECCLAYYDVFQSEHNCEDINEFIVVLSPPDLRTLIITHTPKLSFEEFVSLIGSLVSLWFGVSVIMLTNSTVDLFGQYVVDRIFRSNRSMPTPNDDKYDDYWRQLYGKYGGDKCNSVSMRRKWSTIIRDNRLYQNDYRYKY
ncbi:uncharacterized protein LOC128960094 [Oppia nitens]|uniref:uncharacterized protein LOC128960094 n=1 Tax=Oppia nitens TaxID=1686743 RepID=UPI0023DC5991|nr:uncharacterized protein LOC128960094 [Oppia nitens]